MKLQSTCKQTSQFDKLDQSNFWGEWPSGLRRCNKNQKVPGSNLTGSSAEFRDPTSLRDFR